MERHEAIVAGAGPAGLATAAMLSKRGFETVVLERTEAVAARWRARYDDLRLNTMSAFSRLPGRRIPRSAGRYPSRDDFVAYLEDYARGLGLEIRFETALERLDPGAGGDWRLSTSAGPLSARYAVMATGHDAVPWLPAWPGRDDFTGELLHAADYRTPKPYAGRRVLVVGAGNSGIDIAGHLIKAGAEVAVAMRTPPNIFPRDWGPLPLQIVGIPADYQPASVGDRMGRMLQRMIYGDLTKHGIPFAPEGFQTKFRTKWIGPAVDDGFVDALKAGRTRVVAAAESFDGADVVLADGSRETPEVVICATGYRRGLEPIVGHLGVLRPDGMPINFQSGRDHPNAPRLYYAGFFGTPSGQIRIFPKHARTIARAAAADRGRRSAVNAAPRPRGGRAASRSPTRAARR